jgi:hypothetical protein
MTDGAGTTSAETDHTVAGTVPDMIAAAGEAAITAYLAFFEQEKWSPTTRKAYRGQTGRFMRWAKARGRTLVTLTPGDRIAYAEEIAGQSSQQSAMVALTGVRGLFRHLSACGALAENPLESFWSSVHQPAEPGFPEPSIPLSELKRAVLEIGKADGWQEDDEDVHAGLVMLAPLSIDTRDPASISRFTGVPLLQVEEYAGRLLANGIWRADGKISGDWDDPEGGGIAFMLDVWVATGLLERQQAPEGDAPPVDDGSKSLTAAEQPAGKRSDGQ